MQEMQLQSLSREDPLGKETATHSSILAWENQWTEEPGSYSPQRVGNDSETKQQQQRLALLPKAYYVFSSRTT